MGSTFKSGALSICAAFLMAGTASNPAYGQDESRQFSAKAGAQVSEAIELANAGQNQAAVGLLTGTISSPDLNAYERSTVYRMLGQYSYELNRPAEAQQFFEKAIEAGGLLPNETENTNVVIAQLMIANGQYREGAERLEAYLNAGGPQNPQHVDLLVNAWVQAEAYQRALPWAEKWFQAASPKTRKHFDMMNFLYNNLGMQGRQADIVKEMVARWPDDKALWDSYASMLSNGGREEEAFEVKKMMYLKGLLTTEPELLKVVQYYSFYDMPYQAAEILETELEARRIARTPENLKRLSGLYRQAREYKRAIPILEAAAGLSGDAKTYAALGEALYNEGECGKSEKAFTEAMNRGYDAGKSWMLIASCRYDRTQALDDLNCDMASALMAEAPITKARDSAIAAFNKVPAGSGESGNARKWVQFITGEKAAVEARCKFKRKIIIEDCYRRIDRFYKQIFLTGDLELKDENCRQYKAEYDAKYRQDLTQE